MIWHLLIVFMISKIRLVVNMAAMLINDMTSADSFYDIKDWVSGKYGCHVFCLCWVLQGRIMKDEECMFVHLSNNYMLINTFYTNLISDVIVSVLASSTVDRELEPQCGQTKDCDIGICCISPKHTAKEQEEKSVNM